MENKNTFKFLLRFNIADSKDAATYKKITDSAYENGRSVNKEILHALRKAYGIKR